MQHLIRVFATVTMFLILIPLVLMSTPALFAWYVAIAALKTVQVVVGLLVFAARAIAEEIRA